MHGGKIKVWCKACFDSQLTLLCAQDQEHVDAGNMSHWRPDDILKAQCEYWCSSLMFYSDLVQYGLSNHIAGVTGHSKTAGSRAVAKTACDTSETASCNHSTSVT